VSCSFHVVSVVTPHMSKKNSSPGMICRKVKLSITGFPVAAGDAAGHAAAATAASTPAVRARILVVGREQCIEYLLVTVAMGAPQGGYRNLIGCGKLDHDGKPTIAAEHLADGIYLRPPLAMFALQMQTASRALAGTRVASATAYKPTRDVDARREGSARKAPRLAGGDSVSWRRPR
jgi:hypothetical protein